MKKLLFLIALLGAHFTLFAQDSDVSKEQPGSRGDSEERVPEQGRAKGRMQAEGEKPHMKRARHIRETNEEERIDLMFFRYLIMEKYDVNRNRRLDEEEKVELRKDAKRFGEQRKAMILKRFDKDKDGKLSDEEKALMHKEIKEEIDKRLKKRQEKSGQNCFPPAPPQKEGPPGEARRGPRDLADRGDAPHPPRRGPDFKDRPRPQENNRRDILPVEIIKVHGYHLMMERYDKDKDGRLSEEEKKAFYADRDAFVKEMKKWRQKAQKRWAAENEKKEEAKEKKVEAVAVE